jgi:hypothetical protein
MRGIYKQCSYCQQTWRQREDMVRDPEVELIGYQAYFDQPADGLFLFTHNAAGCRTTIAVRAGDFEDYAADSAAAIPSAGAVVCPGHCLHHDNLEPCGADCEMRWVREAMRLLRRHAVPETIPHVSSIRLRHRRSA